MKRNTTKRSIYIGTFGAFLATYLVLMIGFSIFLVSQEKKLAGIELARYASYMNYNVGEVLKNNIDSNNEIIDIGKVKKEMIKEIDFYSYLNVEAAIFTGDYKLLFNTNDYWLCSYTEYKEGTTHYTGYRYLNPNEWFSEEEIVQLENYLYAKPKAEKEGDLAGYSLGLKGFWVDNEMIIPDKITVTPMYAQTFDENGNVTGSGGVSTDDIIYSSGYKDTKGLPYYEYGSINTPNSTNRHSEKQAELRQIVMNPENLMDQEKLIEALWGRSIERVGFLTYRYYQAMPYQNTIYTVDDEIRSDFWVVVGQDKSMWERCGFTLIFVWISCLIIFTAVALILSRQTYRTYKKQEDFEKQRQEMTNALAHDLKTPLSIISGYAQNLQENVHTEKRDHYAHHIQTNVERMDKIIRRMLELTKLESDFIKINLADISLREICEKVVKGYKFLCDEKDIAISIEGNGFIKADSSLIERVIDNFFINALDHTPEGGEIRISISNDSFEIYNSGSQIPEDKLKEIWLPYKKADTSRSHTKGTGLGLAIARTILDLHSFSYGAKNTNKGVIFWFKK